MGNDLRSTMGNAVIQKIIMIELKKFTFFTRKRLFVKNDDEDDNLHDKSLWRISLTLPPDLLAD